jgi:hypothetical protein
MITRTFLTGVDVLTGRRVTSAYVGGEHKSTLMGFSDNSNGTKWFGIQMPEDGRDPLLHITTIGTLDVDFAGLNVVFKMGIVLSNRPLTGG